MMCKLSCIADAQPASPSAGGGGSSGAQGEPGGQRAEDRGARAARAPPAARGLKGNWEALWAAVAKDHCHAGLIWNETTRAELREALQVLSASLLGRAWVGDSSSLAGPLPCVLWCRVRPLESNRPCAGRGSVPVWCEAMLGCSHAGLHPGSL